MWDNLKASIASVVRTNNNQEITGANLQGVLNTIVNSVGANATFAGIAIPSTNPGTPDGPVFYIACEPGVYSNFNLTLVNGLYILENKTGSWVGTQINTGAAFEALIGYYNAVLNGASITVPEATTYRLTKGGVVRLKMLAPGTTATTLTIGNATDIPIWYNGAAVSAQNTWDANEIISVFYDGTRFMASNSQGGGGKAEKIKYINSQSRLAAENVQDAIDEIDGTIDKIERGEVDDTNVPLGSSINNYIGGTGSWKLGGTHYLIRVYEGDVLNVSVSDDYTYYAWLNGTETSGTPSYSDGSTQAKAIGRGTTVLTVPANTKYIYFLRTIGSASHSPSTIIIKSFFKETKEKLEVLDETINEIELINESCTKDYDLAFNDEYGYTIVKFIDGHIKTKNFDSRDISIDLALNFIKNKFYGKKCAIVGDSISTFRGWMPSGYAVYYPQGDVQSVNQTWWKITCDKLGMTPVNCAWSGSRVTGTPKGTTASAGCSDKRMEDVGRSGNPDIIIFFIGCNDWGNEVSIGTWNVNSAIVDDSEYTSSQTILDFRAAYALMLKKAQVSYPNAKIFCCTILDDIQRDSNVNYPSNNGNGVTTYTWNQSIKEIADALGVSVIDMHACGINYANLLDFVVDNGLHPNAAGHIKMANKVISELLSK